ncbi:MAG: amidohydrolase family protein [Proteobacteria bacterium]|nr:amidohydrolase family protein [Pseudomonadota bacterium]
MNPETKPLLIAPPGTCDSHVHVYDKAFPTIPNAVARAPEWATVAAYRKVQARLGLTRSVIVQPTVYGTDNRVTLAAIAELGAECTRGVAIVDTAVSDAELERLTKAGIRGARFQMLPGGIVPWEALEPLAARIAPLGWHAQVQMDGRLLPEREAMLARLPCRLVIDHTGKFLTPVPVDHPGVASLRRLLDNGRTWLKLSGPYETSLAGPPDYPDVGAIAKVLAKAAPERMLWASNWPHVSVTDLPDDATLLDVLLDWIPDATARTLALTVNPAAVYGF